MSAAAEDKRVTALLRLGALIEACPVCKRWFALNRVPRHWMHIYLNGELIEHVEEVDGIHDLFCSKPCAETYIAQMNTNAQRRGLVFTKYVYFEDTCEDP